LLWLLVVKKTMSFLSLQQWSKHQHLLLTHLPLLLLLTHRPLLLPTHLPLLLLLLTHQPLLLLMLLLLQLSNLRFNLKLFVKKPSFGVAFFLPVRFVPTSFPRDSRCTFPSSAGTSFCALQSNMRKY
jgi:hypothetical protein